MEWLKGLEEPPYVKTLEHSVPRVSLGAVSCLSSHGI